MLFFYFIFCKAQQSVAAQQNYIIFLLWLIIKIIWPLCSSYLYFCETGSHDHFMLLSPCDPGVLIFFKYEWEYRPSEILLIITNNCGQCVWKKKYDVILLKCSILWFVLFICIYLKKEKDQKDKQYRFMLHSRAIGMIINTSFLVGDWTWTLEALYDDFWLGNMYLQ